MFSTVDDRSPARRARRAGRSIAVVTVAPEGRKLLRLEIRNAETPIERKPN
ncbi:lipoyl synthase, partial [Rhodococcus sp. NPDC057014]